MPKPAKEVEFEVEPPPGKAANPHHDPFIELVTKIMDEIFVIPGTKIRFGLDPIISLLPGFGASASAVVSLVLIALCSRRGVPRIVLTRMGLNVLINAALDAVPVVGDTLSIFYRSNSKNYELLLKHAGTKKASTKGDWIFLWVLLGSISFILLLMIVGVVTVAAWIYHQFQTAPH